MLSLVASRSFDFTRIVIAFITSVKITTERPRGIIGTGIVTFFYHLSVINCSNCEVNFGKTV